MFIGHVAVGFAAKRAAPRTSLGLLVAAPLFADLLWPIFLLLGWESLTIDPDPPNPFLSLSFANYPISHSLLALTGWALAAAGIYWAATKYGPGTLWIAIGVVSHWVLDFVTHRPDMPLWPGGPEGRSRALELGNRHARAGVRNVCGRSLALRPDDPSA